MVGERCTVERTSAEGVCSYIKYCPEVQQEFMKGLPFTSCTSANDQKVVCCEIYEPTTTTTPPEESMESKPVHERKCREYKSAVFKDSNVSIFVEGIRYKENRCAHNTVPLIVGGADAVAGEFPHMALLGYTDINGTVEWGCGGSLISDKFVLTAGHCLLTNFK